MANFFDRLEKAVETNGAGVKKRPKVWESLIHETFTLKVMVDDDLFDLKFCISNDKDSPVKFDLDHVDSRAFLELRNSGNLEPHVYLSSKLPTYGWDNRPVFQLKTNKSGRDGNRLQVNPDNHWKAFKPFSSKPSSNDNIDFNPSKSNSGEGGWVSGNGPLIVDSYLARDWIIPKPPAGWIWPGWSSIFYHRDISQQYPSFQNRGALVGNGFWIINPQMPKVFDDSVSSMRITLNSSGLGYNPQEVWVHLFSAPNFNINKSAWSNYGFLASYPRYPWYEYSFVLKESRKDLNDLNERLRKFTTYEFFTWFVPLFFNGNFDNELSSYEVLAKL